MAEDRIITLNIGSQQVTGAVFSKTAGGGLRLERLERREFVGDPADTDVRNSQGAAALKEIVTSLKAKGAKTTYVVSSFPVLMKFASLPALDGEQVDQIVEFEAQQQVPYPINEVVWGYQLMGDPDDIEVEVVLAAVKSDELNEIDDMVTSAGLRSMGAEVSPVAMYNALRFNYSDVEGTTLLVDIGARTTDMIFMEEGKVFVRTVKIGGADITRAIAKEFGNDFGASDFRKVADGFVALGGAYADHEDPEIAGISKVVRNSLTRLHSEIMRTINFYRSQQAGAAPTFVLLSGASAGLPFIREFFAEKLSLPVDHFNAFRNVTVAGSVDRELVQSNAHSLGDVVGSAIGRVGEVPVDVLLMPESVQKAKDLQKRKPALILAVAALAVFLGGLGFYFSKASEVAIAKGNDIEVKALDLKKYNDTIEALKADIEKIDSQKSPYVDAVKHRVYWVQVFNKLAEKMDGDILFMTVLEPLSEGRPVIADQDSDLLAVAGTVDATIDSFSIEGLWRENADGGSKVVTDYFSRLKADSEDETKSAFFALEGVDIGQIIEVDAGTGDDRYAYPFKMVLPLPEENKVKFTK
ncbi:MAG: pilus assembly protein PilM [Verrucomicrobiales bacterium]|nr:pilus assembly protein PilM [Verrucomicrobiales bacterium]